jgi:hypothetical protein
MPGVSLVLPRTPWQPPVRFVQADLEGELQLVDGPEPLGERGEEGGSGSAGRARVTERCVGLWRLSGAR